MTETQGLNHSTLPARTTTLPAVSGPPSPAEWQAMKQQAAVILKSGLAPKSLNSAEKILTVALKGRELQIPPMMALSHIHVVEGKPTMSAELMVALVQRAGHKVRVTQTTADQCVVEGERVDDPDHPSEVSFSMQDAQTAGVANKQNWQRYPAAMLRARAISALCRFAFADVLMGVSYVPEELGAEVDEQGRVIEAEGVEEDAPERTEEHEQLMNQISELFPKFPEGKAPSPNKVLPYANRSIANARAALVELNERLENAIEASAEAPTKAEQNS